MHDAIIVGAGFAGLAAAKELNRRGIENFRVFEARDRVGGRTRLGTIGNLQIDLGGMWLGPTQTRLAAHAEQYQIRTYPTFLEGKAIYRIGDKEHHGKREDLDGLFNLRDGFSYVSMRRKFRRLSKDLDCERPWDHPDAHALDALTLEQWLAQNVSSDRLKRFMRLACESACKIDPPGWVMSE